eukprot:18283-Heterococcus_DN1.PRE.2
MLIYTHTGCPWDASILPQKAAFGGNVELLQWLKELHVGSWEPNDLAFMLSTAGEEGRLDAAKWLRSIGAPWPKTLWRTLEFTDDPVWHCFWRLDLLQYTAVKVAVQPPLDRSSCVFIDERLVCCADASCTDTIYCLICIAIIIRLGTQQWLSMRVSEVNAEKDINQYSTSYYAVAVSNHMIHQP